MLVLPGVRSKNQDNRTIYLKLTSKGLSIKYVTIFFWPFSAPFPCRKLSHISDPQKYVTLFNFQEKLLYSFMDDLVFWRPFLLDSLLFMYYLVFWWHFLLHSLFFMCDLVFWRLFCSIHCFFTYDLLFWRPFLLNLLFSSVFCKW